MTTISRFDCDIRSQVIIELARDSDDVHKCAEAVSLAERAQADGEDGTDDDDDGGGGGHTVDEEETNNNNNNNGCVIGGAIVTETAAAKSHGHAAHPLTAPTSVISSLEALTAACGEKILNPDFLLQGGGINMVNMT